MKSKILLCSLWLIAAACLVQTSNAQATNTGDSLALVDLYNSTNGPNWYNHKNWLSGPVPTWYNVTVTNGRVTSLIQGGNNLSGTIPASIGNLTHLSYLDLRWDSLTGSIPASIGRLVNLTHLDFSQDELSGPLPDSIGNLTKLTELVLSGNQLSGPIPATIGNLSSLTSLELIFNHFSGSIPPSLGKLKNCYLLGLSGNELSGTIPSAIGNMSSLQLLDIAQNNLTGSFPPSFARLKKLAGINAFSNHLYQAQNISYPDALPDLNNVLLYFNNLNFNGLESLYANVQYVNCNAQAPLPVHLTDTLLSVSAGGTLSNNTYSWYRVGGASPAVITGDSVFHPTQSGSYFAQITNAIAKLVLTTDTVAYTAPFAKAAALSVSLSPVPAKDRLTVSGLPPQANCRLVISDAYGTVWLSKQSGGQAIAFCDVSRLKTGTYTIVITDGNSRQSARFVKE